MVPLIETELVNKRKWISQSDFLDLMALAQTVPGIFAVNIAIFIGYKLRKFWGAFWMALGTILPSFFIILAIALFFQQMKDNSAVESIFKGIPPSKWPNQPVSTDIIYGYRLFLPYLSGYLISPLYTLLYLADWEDTYTDVSREINKIN